jgi:hypothetical protein
VKKKFESKRKRRPFRWFLQAPAFDAGISKSCKKNFRPAGKALSLAVKSKVLQRFRPLKAA